MATMESENKKERTFLLDLTSVIPYSINIGKQWYISIPSPEKRFGGLIVPHIEKKVYLQVGIKNDEKANSKKNEALIVDDVLEVDKDKLFTIIFNGQEEYLTEYSKIEIELKNDKTYFQLLLNPAAIRDCKEPQLSTPRTYKISLPLVLTNEKGEIIDSKTEVINIKFVEIHTRPNVEIEIEKEWKEFEYRREDDEEKMIGKIVISNPAKLKYFPSIDIQAKFNVKFNEKTLESSPVRLDFDDAIYDDFISNNKANAFGVMDYKSTELNKSKVIEIPILADIQRIGNPYEADSRTYQLELEVTYRQHKADKTDHKAERTDVMKKSDSFTIKRDASKAELHVFTGTNEIFNNEPINLVGDKEGIKERVEFIYDQQSPNFKFPLAIKNTATNGLFHSGLIIGDFRYDVDFEEDNVVEVYDNDKRRDEVFHFTDSNGGSLLKVITESHYQIDSVPESEIKLLLTFTGKDIKQLYRIHNQEGKYDTTVLVKFSFNYWVNDWGYNIGTVINSDKHKKQSFEATLKLPVFQKPCAEWLGIDFGTSAIVCMYDNRMLDLREQKTKLFKDKDPHYESGTKFLSSNAIFRANAEEWRNPDGEVLLASQLLSENNTQPHFHSLAVCLSPTWEQEGRNYRFVLPCLKLIVGYELLPQLDSYPNDQFSYYTGNGIERQRNHLMDINHRPTRLAKVDNIIDEVYRELFQYYIRTCLPKNIPNERINRLVLTVPNTFSPRHKETIKSIVKQSFSHLNIRDICFVSESDAVACYYLKNRPLINKHIDRSISSLDEIENILVYDMGAGTLDLSLFSLEPAENDTRKVTVLGKIGLSKAGNYLDFVLANIIAEIVKEKDNETAEKLKSYIDCASVDVLDSARDLKSFIKEELKPAIGSKIEEVVLDSGKYDKLGLTKNLPLSIAMITASKQYQDYIRECTELLIDNFFHFLHLPEGFRLDTVIVSGRSSKLKHIREALVRVIEPYKRTETFRLYNTSEGTDDASKTAVVEGAMKYAKEMCSDEPTISFIEDNITPNYGIIYNDVNGEDKYEELFNPRTATPIIQEIDNKGKKEKVKTYKTVDITLDLRHTDNLILIQSYSGDTENDWKAGNMDYISIVQTYSTAHFGQLQNARIHIEVDCDNMLKLVVNDRVSDDYSPNRIDLTQSSISKSLWPKVQENANQNQNNN